MVTKAELEAEVAVLRKQLEEQPASTKAEPRSEAGEMPDSGSETDAAETAQAEDWLAEVQQVLTGLEDLPHKKPLMFALGAFALGYLIGRTR